MLAHVMVGCGHGTPQRYRYTLVCTALFVFYLPISIYTLLSCITYLTFILFVLGRLSL